MRIIIAYCLLFFPAFFNVYGQDDIIESLEYRRSSLSLILIESGDFLNHDMVMKSWRGYPFPDKYNKHEIGVETYDLGSMNLTSQEYALGGFPLDTIRGIGMLSSAFKKKSRIKYLNSDNTLAVVYPEEKDEYEIKIEKTIKEQRLANKIVGTWYGYKNGKFDQNLELIKERGFYDATSYEAAVASGQARGTASLGDAGMDLIKNSYVTFTKLRFHENEPVAREIRDKGLEELKQKKANMSDVIYDLSKNSLEVAYEATKEGYTLTTMTWLYQLDWNDSIEHVFYEEFWEDPKGFEKSDLFSLSKVGFQRNRSIVLIGADKTMEEIIDLALVRNIDNAFAKLQRNYDDFKPVIPVLGTDPITADIGMKEGLKGGERFDVFTIGFNRRTGAQELNKVGTVRAVRGSIWDNRYNAGEEPENIQKDKNGNEVRATIFKGSKKITSGMVMKQVN